MTQLHLTWIYKYNHSYKHRLECIGIHLWYIFCPFSSYIWCIWFNSLELSALHWANNVDWVRNSIVDFTPRGRSEADRRIPWVNDSGSSVLRFWSDYNTSFVLLWCIWDVSSVTFVIVNYVLLEVESDDPSDNGRLKDSKDLGLLGNRRPF